MIDAEDIHYSYPNKVEALKGVSLTIKDGEFVAIMGQNGAGKSTFVKHFNGLLNPTSEGSCQRSGNNQNKRCGFIQKRRFCFPEPRPPIVQ